MTGQLVYCLWRGFEGVDHVDGLAQDFSLIEIDHLVRQPGRRQCSEHMVENARLELLHLALVPLLILGDMKQMPLLVLSRMDIPFLVLAGTKNEFHKDGHEA